jgi:hypothetical protein
MSYTWFKLHHDMPDDIKLRRFTPQEKWAWVALLCLASKSAQRGVINAEDEDIAEYCEFNCTQDWLYYRDKLIAKGMLEIGGDGNLHILHWKDRQYEKPSDRPEAVKARVTRHRLNKKKEQETRCNALQTPSNADVTPQIQTRSDTEEKEEINTVGNPVAVQPGESESPNGRKEAKKKAKPKCDGFESIWKDYPGTSSGEKGVKSTALEKYKALVEVGYPEELIAQVVRWDIDRRNRLWQKKEFCESFNHLHRYLRKESFESKLEMMRQSREKISPTPQPLAPEIRSLADRLNELRTQLGQGTIEWVAKADNGVDIFFDKHVLGGRRQQYDKQMLEFHIRTAEEKLHRMQEVVS